MAVTAASIQVVRPALFLALYPASTFSLIELAVLADCALAVCTAATLRTTAISTCSWSLSFRVQAQ